MLAKRVEFPIAALMFFIPIVIYVIILPDCDKLSAFAGGFTITLYAYMALILLAKNLGVALLSGIKCFVISAVLRLLGSLLAFLAADYSTYVEVIFSAAGNVVYLGGAIAVHFVVSGCIDHGELYPTTPARSACTAGKCWLLPFILLMLSAAIPVVPEVLLYTSVGEIVSLVIYLLGLAMYFLPWLFLCRWASDPYFFVPLPKKPPEPADQPQQPEQQADPQPEPQAAQPVPQT